MSKHATTIDPTQYHVRWDARFGQFARVFWHNGMPRVFYPADWRRR